MLNLLLTTTLGFGTNCGTAGAYNGNNVTGLTPYGTAMTIYSSSLTEIPFGQGTLCVAPFAPGAGRLAPVRLDSEGNGTPGAMMSIPGFDTVYNQVWYRVGGSWNLTNYVSF